MISMSKAGDPEKNLSPRQDSNLLPPKHREGTLSTELRRTHGKRGHTAISRKVLGKNVHPTIPKGNIGYDQYTVPDTVAFEPTFVTFR